MLTVILGHGLESAQRRPRQEQPPLPTVASSPSAPLPDDRPVAIEKEVVRTQSISVPFVPKRNGIFVGPPKIYDNHSLQTLLTAARARLSQIHGFDQAALLKQLGALQGANVSQMQVGLQASGLPLASDSVTTTTNAENTVTTVSATENKTLTNSPTSQVVAKAETPQVQATIPTPPVSPAVSVPSSFSVSSLDMLGEQTQLQFELINLQLLLGGSLTDDFLPNSGLVRRRITIGFPITITTPTGFNYRNAAAEVEIAICNSVESPYRNSPPTLVTLLPRERTYNVANVVSRAASIGTGAVAGVVNVGGGFLRGRQTLYVVRDQDTVALARESTGLCQHTVVYKGDERIPDDPRDDKTTDLSSTQVTFAWQFRPVLGRHVVTTGTREMFAQISVPPAAGVCPQQAVVKTVWRRYDSATGRVGDEIGGSAYTTWLPLPGYDMTPRAGSVKVLDNGDGTLTLRASGTFTSSVRVRVGNAIYDDTTPGFERTSSTIQFVAPAAAIASKGAYLVDGDAHEAPLVADKTLQRPCKVEQDIVAASVAASKTTDGGAAGQTPANVPSTSTAPKTPTITAVTTATSSITITLPDEVKKRVPEPNVPIVLLGSRVFGLRDAPFDANSNGTVTFRAPTQLIRASRELKFMHLFTDTVPIVFPLGSDATDTTISTLTLLSADAANGNAYLVSGTNLGDLKINYPSTAAVPTPDPSGTTAVFALTIAELKGVKNIVLQKGSEPPIVLPLPTGTPDAKPPLDSMKAGIAVGTKTLDVTGAMYNLVAAVRYLERPVAFFVDKPGQKLIVQLPDALTAVPGTQVLEFVFSDKTTARYEVQVEPKK